MSAPAPEVSAYVGLGSNVGDRLGALRAAVRALAALPATRVVAVSGVFETEAHIRPGQLPQPDHLNAVAHLATRLEPEDLLERLHAIEHDQGRRPAPVWSPRVLDLDLLLWADARRSGAGEGLVLPHPRLGARRFVLAPLAELAPDLVVPGLGTTVAGLLADTPDTARLARTDLELRKGD